MTDPPSQRLGEAKLKNLAEQPDTPLSDKCPTCGALPLWGHCSQCGADTRAPTPLADDWRSNEEAQALIDAIHPDPPAEHRGGPDDVSIAQGTLDQFIAQGERYLLDNADPDVLREMVVLAASLAAQAKHRLDALEAGLASVRAFLLDPDLPDTDSLERVREELADLDPVDASVGSTTTEERGERSGSSQPAPDPTQADAPHWCSHPPPCDCEHNAAVAVADALRSLLNSLTYDDVEYGHWTVDDEAVQEAGTVLLRYQA